jgi:SAM-dependent methyltransferase
MAIHPTGESARNFQHQDKTGYAGTDELWANEKYLPRYNASVVALLSRRSAKKRDVLEFGAGIGTLAGLWHAATGIKPDCVEIDSDLRALLARRQFNCLASIDAAAKQYDVIYTSNVLEHIEDDVGALRKIHGHLKPDGLLAIYVPACMSLYCDLDSAVGHFRRYEKKEMLSKLAQAGYAVAACHYADSVGFFAWMYLKLRGAKFEGNPEGGGRLKVYDQYIYPVSSLLDNMGARFLLGKNLLVIARKAA